MTQKLFAIGDIHGQYKAMIKLIDQAGIDIINDKVIFLGDYIDRGPKSFEVIEYLINRPKNAIFLYGNHESMLPQYGPMNNFWIANGGNATISSYKSHGIDITFAIPQTHYEFFDDLYNNYYYTTKDFIFVHAGISIEIYNRYNHIDRDDALWSRDNFIQNKTPLKDNKRVVYGHTVVQTPLVMDNKIGIDTGAGYRRALTCVELTNPEDPVFTMVDI